VSRRPCGSLAELRSAYVDNALSDGDRDRLLVHLAGCAACRSDVAELRKIRQLLTVSRTDPSAPADLSSRLVAIAGRHASDPLWSRPFRRTCSGVLPSQRHARRVRLGSATLALAALVSMAAGLGYSAAPSMTLTAVDDPTAHAQAEFTSMLSQSKLTSESVGAVMLARAENLSPSLTSRLPTADQDTQPQARLSSAEVRSVLKRASSAAGQYSYSGTQAFTAIVRGHRLMATVDIDARKEQGSQVTVYNQRGEKVMSGFMPPAVTSRMVDTQLLGLLERNYVVSGWTGSRVANRPATVVEAATGGRLAARWWIDDSTGLLLGQENYDRNGQLILSSRFTALQMADSGSILDHLPPRLGAQTTTTALTVSNAADLTTRGWSCPDTAAGLALVRIRSDRPDDPNVLHLIYSDGLSTVSVFEQQGQLTSPPNGSQWDANLGAYLRQGTSGMATWQSGTVVYTVVTDGPAELLPEAVRDLPHAPPASRTTMERIRAGWVEILARVMR
jgi:anti-sigma factor RsiW